jgi:outer membrane receptor for ferrienterochelin and colicins
MVLFDGMPIVSSLSTVYGLMGIPTSLVDRVEVIKEPASALYGYEASEGLINIITKNAEFDIGYAYAINQGIRGFIGLRYYLK